MNTNDHTVVQMYDLLCSSMDITLGYIHIPVERHYPMGNPRARRWPRHAQRHKYACEFLEYEDKDQNPIETITIAENGVQTVIKILMLKRDGQAMYPEEINQADVVFETLQIEGKFHLKVTKHRGRSFQEAAQEIKQVNTYYRRYLY